MVRRNNTSKKRLSEKDVLDDLSDESKQNKRSRQPSGEDNEHKSVAKEKLKEKLKVKKDKRERKDKKKEEKQEDEIVGKQGNGLDLSEDLNQQSSSAANFDSNLVTERIADEDDVVDMGVLAEGERNNFPSDEEGEIESEDEMDKEYEEPDLSPHTQCSEVTEVTFNEQARSNNNNVAMEKSSDEDDFNQEEMKSMMKFAKFLEMNGYIKKVENTPMKPNDGINGSGNTNENKRKNEKVIYSTNPGMLSANSETTIYERAVQMDIEQDDQLNSKRGSTSSEDANTSDELLEVNRLVTTNVVTPLQIDERDQVLYQRFLDCRLKEQRQEVRRKSIVHPPVLQKSFNAGQETPGTSREGASGAKLKNSEITAADKACEMIHRAEENKARILEVPGNNEKLRYSSGVFEDLANEKQSGSDFLHSVLVDDQYAIVASHVDDNTRRKIIEGMYVDFAKLIPKDRIRSEEDKRMEFMNKNRYTYLMPVAERESVSITNFQRWEQAF